MPYVFDGERDPLIYMHLHGWAKDRDLQQLLGDMDRLVQRERPFAAVLDCQELRVPELAQLRRLAGWFGDNFDAAAHYHRGVACVVTSPMVRGSLRTVMQLQRMPMPIHVVESVALGFEWAASKLEVTGLHRAASL